MSLKRSRLAPSPTGSLHLGNASTFLINWALARASGWELIMRVEDLNGPRIHTESIQQTLDILHWLGIDWDGEVFLQSNSLQDAQSALTKLIELNTVYHCNLTRTEIELASSAPHAKDTPQGKGVRPIDIHQHNLQKDDTPTNWRFIVQDHEKEIQDEICGNVTFPQDQDFIVWTRSGFPSYQLAVVVDDHNQGITDVLRGNDLLQSASWQEQIYKSMGWESPRWWHVPLVVGEDGKRLAKRHGDSRLTTYRSRKVPPERVIGLIAKWCGIQSELSPMSPDLFCTLLDLTHLPSEDMVFTLDEEKWLLN